VRNIDAIVIHCSDSPDALDVGVDEIREWHTAPPLKPGEQPKRGKIYGNGWADVAYHYVIRRNGEIECGRMESVKGAHSPPMNATSIGVCWVGDTTPSTEQRAALVKITRELMLRYSVPVHRVFGHRESDPTCGKTCPNLDMVKLREECGQ
jgi:N-acetylmuramoyl-L-alanine amidase